VNTRLPLIRSTTQRLGLNHLEALEAESIYIMREAAAQFAKPVMLYSIGKDSSVMLHLAGKAFWPGKPPFPLLPGGGPFTHGATIHTDIMKTVALKQALEQHGFDAALGGARRDEEKSRAEERIFSFRTASHRWDPRSQRPELWKLYNGRIRKGESIRVFPLSNWTELDIWQYIEAQGMEVVPLYFAKERPVVVLDGALIVVDDERMPLSPGEQLRTKLVRFRTLGCYPLTVRSGAMRAQLRISFKRCSRPGPASARRASSITMRPLPWRRRSRKAIFDGPDVCEALSAVVARMSARTRHAMSPAWRARSSGTSRISQAQCGLLALETSSCCVS
jgi:sulfate adenylyltransferase subunit 2